MVLLRIMPGIAWLPRKICDSFFLRSTEIMMAVKWTVYGVKADGAVDAVAGADNDAAEPAYAAMLKKLEAGEYVEVSLSGHPQLRRIRRAESESSAARTAAKKKVSKKEE